MKAVLALILIALAIPLQADVIKLRSDIWCPYNCEHESDQLGYMIDVAVEIFEAAGHTIDYKTMNWSRTIRDVRNGVYDAAIGATKDEVPDFVFPKEVQGKAVDAFYARRPYRWKYNGPKSLISLRVGLCADYDYGKLLNAFVKDSPEFFQFATGDDPVKRNIRKLLANRVDVIVADRNVMKFTSQIMRVSSKIVQVGEIKNLTEEDENLYIAFSPKNPKSKLYAKILSDGWKRLRKSGRLGEILKRYGIKDWK